MKRNQQMNSQQQTNILTSRQLLGLDKRKLTFIVAKLLPKI